MENMHRGTTPPQTPPHYPTYGVGLTDETISTILRHVFPDSAAAFTISRLPRGMSYNNKIYMIHPQENVSSSKQSYVLKVIGRFFGPAKVDNEVLSLLLLNHYCPDVPVPVIKAWSRDGTNMTRRNPDGTLTNIVVDAPLGGEDVPGWILMSLLPGLPLERLPEEWATTSSHDKTSLSLELASMIASWRQKIPAARSSANLHLQPYSSDTANRSLYPASSAVGSDVHVYGVIDVGNDSCPPATSLLEYWQTEFEWRMTKVSTRSVFAPNREALLPLLRNFVHEILPKIPLFQNDSLANFTFTHTDLFPRNVLFQGSPPKITGIVDFEFSGFFPLMDEFIQEWMPEDEDWPQDMHEMILKELGRLGETTPRSPGFSEVEWRQVKSLNMLKEYIAPWWIDEATEENDEIKEGLAKSREEVETAVKEFERMISD